jgi:hypothetical protein
LIVSRKHQHSTEGKIMSELGDKINFYQEMQDLGFTPAEADSLYRITRRCLVTDGKFGAGVGGITGALLGGSVSLGSLSVPGWAVGLLVGASVGTAKCAATPARIKAQYGIKQVKRELDRILSFRFLTEPIDKSVNSD